MSIRQLFKKKSGDEGLSGDEYKSKKKLGASFNKFLNNHIAKAICFVAAFVIYFYHQISSVSQKNFIVPLTVKSDGAVLPVSGLESCGYVNIRIRTKSELLASIDEKELNAYIDFSNCTEEGSFVFPVIVGCEDRIRKMEPLEIISTPSKLEVKVESKIVKAVKVESTVLGEVAYGYKLVSEECNPAFVTVSGPRSMVEKIDSLPVPVVDVSGATKSVSISQKIINTNKMIDIYPSKNINVNVGVIPEGMSKDLHNIAVSLVNADESFDFSSSIQSCSVSIEGSLLDIENFKADRLKITADCSRIKEDGVYDIPLQFDIPGNFKIDRKSADSIKVTAVKKHVEVADDSDGAETLPEENIEGNEN